MRGNVMAERWAKMTPEEQKAAIEYRKQKRIENKAKGIVKKLTLGRAVKLKCADCMGGNKAEVRKCTSGPDSKFPCPLWQWRCKNPHNIQETSNEEEELMDDEEDDIDDEEAQPEPDLETEIQPIPE